MIPELHIGAHTVSSYVLFNQLSFCAILICNFCYVHREYEIIKNHPLISRFSMFQKAPLEITIVIIILLSILTNRVQGVCNGFWSQVTDVRANYFGNVLWAPILLFLLFILLRIDPVRQMDFLTPSCAMALVFYKLACFFGGCCQGKEWEYGVYFVDRQRYEIPCQLIEAFWAAAIFVVLVWLIKKQRFTGRQFPLYLILYSGTRFFSEFLREGEVVLWGLQLYHLQCLAGVALGIVELLLLKKYAPAISAYFSDCWKRKEIEKIDENM